MGCEEWPDQMLYNKCPACGEQTSRFSNGDPIDEDVAKRLLLDTQFEAYYERHCAKRGIPVDGPIPDTPEQEAADATFDALAEQLRGL